MNNYKVGDILICTHKIYIFKPGDKIKILAIKDEFTDCVYIKSLRGGGGWNYEIYLDGCFTKKYDPIKDKFKYILKDIKK